MAIWSVIASKIKEIIQGMIGSRTIEQSLHVTPAISSKMENSIQLWSDMYKDQAPWLNEPSTANPVRIVSLGLPALIASEKARTALLELETEITTPTEEIEVENPKYSAPEEDEFGNLIPSAEPKLIKENKPIGPTDRAEYLNNQYKKLKKQLRKQIEYGIAKGGLVIKPYLVLNEVDEDELGSDKIIPKIEFDFIQADSFYPMAFDAAGRITEAAFIQTKLDKDLIYRRLEYHKWTGTTVQVVNKAYKSTNTDTTTDMTGIDLGKEIPLTEVPEWKDTPASTTIKNVVRPLFAYFKVPEANTVDTSSPLGVSGYSRAVSLIKDADMQYSRLLWEYEAGEMAVNIDRDAFKFMEDLQGQEHTVLGTMQERLYRRVDIEENELFEPYAPALRDSNYLEGLNTILMRIEDVCGISRGTLSNVADTARTATELKILKQRSFQTNEDIQKSIEETLRDVVYIMNIYCDLYEITSPGKYEISFEWDDSLIVDIDEEIDKRIVLLNQGIASKLETRMWYFGETEGQAAEALKRVNEESLQFMKHDLAMQSNQFNMGNDEELPDDTQRVKKFPNNKNNTEVNTNAK